MASTARPTTVMPIVAAGELIGSASIVEKHAKGDEDRGGAAAVEASRSSLASSHASSTR